MSPQTKVGGVFILFILICFAQCGVRRKKVVIIGAGISGLSAARAISQSGLADVRLVEASDRFGGRVMTAKHKGRIYERGAQWMHGTEENPVFEYLKDSVDYKIEEWIRYTPPKNSKLEYYSGREVTPDIKDLFRESANFTYDIEKEIERLIEVENITKEETANMRLGDVARKVWDELYGYYNSDRGLSKSVTDPIFATKLVLLDKEDGGNPDIVNILAWYQFEEYGDHDAQVLNGYNRLANKLRKSFGDNVLKLNRKVISIEWFKEKEDQVVVRYQTRSGRKGKILADYVLVTVSLGVLKKYHNTLFVPNLPAAKQDAIEKMGFGTINRIVLFFENPFWGPDFADVYMLWDSYDTNQNKTSEDEFAREDHWCRNLDTISTYRKNFLVLWLTKDATMAIRNISKSDIKSTVTNLLRRFLNLPDLSGPDDIIITEWDLDDHYLGSYSYPAVGQTEDQQKILAEPLYVNGNPRVMFAGEAVSTSRYGTVDGAFATGKREGERIMKLLEDVQ